MGSEAVMDKQTLELVYKGREHYEAREFDKAEAYLLRVAKINEEFADVMNMLGVIYHTRGKTAQAQDFFEKALKINPSYIEAALNLAVTYNDMGQYSKARELYSNITNQKIDDENKIESFARGKLANMHAELGQAYAEVRKLDNAISQYHQALELCPDFVDIRTRLGQTLRDAGDLLEACIEFEKAKLSKPSFIPARISLGITYLALGKRELARDEWQSAMELDPDNVTAANYLKMVDQMLLQDDDIEIVHMPSAPPSPDEEVKFSFNGEQSEVSTIDTNGKENE